MGQEGSGEQTELSSRWSTLRGQGRSHSPLANLVRQWGCGIVLSSDGGSVEDIKAGIGELLARRDEFRKNAEECRSSLTWESQKTIIMNISGVQAGGCLD